MSNSGSSKNVEENAPPEKPLRYQFYDQLQKLCTNAFGLVAALAWNQAITALFVEIFGSGSSNNTVSLFLYAFIVTISVVIATFAVGVMVRKVQEYDQRTARMLTVQKEKMKLQIKQDLLREMGITKAPTQLPAD